MTIITKTETKLTPEDKISDDVDTVDHWRQNKAKAKSMMIGKSTEEVSSCGQGCEKAVW